MNKIHFSYAFFLCVYRAPVAQLVGHRVVTRVTQGLRSSEFGGPGREFDSDRTNTQGLKITEEKVLPS